MIFHMLALLLLLGMPGLAAAALYTATPAENLAAVIGQLRPGDTLELSGTFTTQLHGLMGTSWPSGTASQPITIKAATGAVARIAPQVSADTVDGLYVTGSYLVFDGIIFDGSGIRSQLGGWLVKFASTATHNTIQNSTLTGYTNVACTGGWLAGCGQGGGIETGMSTDNVFRNNTFSQLTAYGLYISGARNRVDGNTFSDIAGYAVHIYNSGSSDTASDNIVINNRIVHNGWNNSNPAGSCAVVAASGSSNLIQNNIVLDHNGCGVQIYATSSNARVLGNTIIGNNGPCIDNQNSNRGSTIKDNLCQANAQDIVDNGVNVTIAHNWSNNMDPGPLNANYEAAPGSAAAAYGAHGVVTPPSTIGGGRPVSRPAPRNLRAGRIS